jgi:hypothetical protein
MREVLSVQTHYPLPITHYPLPIPYSLFPIPYSLTTPPTPNIWDCAILGLRDTQENWL